MKTFQYLCAPVLVLMLLAGCDDHGDPQGDITLNEEQRASVSMRGKWGLASDALLPFGTTPGVLDGLVIDFRIDDDYYPSDFTAVGAPYFFEGENGKWSWADETLSVIALENILPVTRLDLMDEGNAIRLSFTYNGPSGGRTSKVGDYGITLRKIAP
jgi:hypothetical protein